MTTPPFKTLFFDTWLIQVGGSAPGSTYALSRQPAGGQLMGLFYNGVFNLNPFHYTVTGRVINLNFTTQLGDNLYAAYMAISNS